MKRFMQKGGFARQGSRIDVTKCFRRQACLPPRMKFCRLLFALACISFALAADRPNVIFVIADDLGYGELGCFGGKDIPTPHIDSLARGGVRFTNAYVTAPFCAASRAALLTGRYQTRFGFEFNP